LLGNLKTFFLELGRTPQRRLTGNLETCRTFQQNHLIQIQTQKITARPSIITDFPFFSLQISLRWIYEQGASMVVKSLKKDRLKENTEIFDWELHDEDRVKISQILQHKKVTVLGLLSPEGVCSIDISQLDIVEM
jgi:aryl-alcohol dehydrogenase-like predicted oxidoreductase